ncbi:MULTISPECIES: dephospho-CoA kinase [Oceanobacillus]|uniref:Dephospho-CoA kinase n=1 Tax=Oceanobacillus profundus TaxID=372463 RepID=A0A417YIZ1_9BACI|nr:dephospho-CoA kinase [Oceanobacillus profundus]MBR3119321.1 dephospho-CoA kinase [Oceanobacillus sp.]MCM3398478.1 dephospho-CoA kinase [Oceanobacillus profundus]PAE30900.1 dephospho-CoA kinase [Paenibacillus sp. 7884-2]RHW32952.1 dephospho-CoA kinase [Oceanobacillus profundus]
MAMVIGLTGSIATGKSTVSQMFKDFEIPVVDADKIAREVVNPGEEAYERVVKVFGESILLPNQTLDRKALGSLIFKDEAKRKLLNSIIHPAIRERIFERKDAHIKAGEQCVVLDVPLLFEGDYSKVVDRTIVVAVDEAVQLERLMKRNELTEEEARERINSQLSIKEKAKLADAVIDNNGTIAQSREQLKNLLSLWNIR